MTDLESLGIVVSEITTGDDVLGHCRWCARPITVKPKRGPIPRYCSRACRQRMYEDNKLIRLTGTSPRLRYFTSQHKTLDELAMEHQALEAIVEML